jgi:hypothetical protein
MNTTDERELILSALQKYVRQRPGFEYGNYGDATSYRADVREATKQLQHAERMLSAVGWRNGIDAQALKDAMRRAFSGRLSWDGKTLSYCAGQYFPMEFRAAACAVLASALWEYWRENGPTDVSGDGIRAFARRELGASIGRRWFR